MTSPQTVYEMHQNSFDLNGSNLSFNDPFTGEPLNPRQVPASIESQPDLHAGLDYLRYRGDSLNATIYGSSHAANSEHRMTELMHAYDTSDVVFLEGIGHDEVARRVLWDIASGEKRELSAAEVARTTPYQRQQFAALLGINRPAFYADLPLDGDVYEQSLKRWNDLFESIDNLPGDKEGIELAKAINIAGTTIMREWYMLASMGKDLRALDIAGCHVRNPLFHVGTLHTETLAQKLRSIGVHTQLITPQLHRKEDNTANTLRTPFSFAEAVGRCATTVE